MHDGQYGTRHRQSGLAGLLTYMDPSQMREETSTSRPPDATAADMTAATADAASQAPVSSARTLAHLLLHLSWAVLFAVGSLAYLSSAPSSAEINVWGVRVFSLMTLGLAGSLLIHRLWWGRKQWCSVWFWLSWWGVIFAGILLGVPVALRLVPL